MMRTSPPKPMLDDELMHPEDGVVFGRSMTQLTMDLARALARMLRSASTTGKSITRPSNTNNPLPSATAASKAATSRRAEAISASVGR